MLPLYDENPTRRFPLVTISLIAICVAVFFLVQPESSNNDDVRFAFEYAAIPCELSENAPLSHVEIARTLQGDETSCDAPDGEPVFEAKHVWLAIVTSMFLHADLLHLGGNMLFLWIFGNNVEDHIGAVRYLGFYLLAGVVASLAHVGVQLDSTVPLIGASGAIAGVMGAYLAWFPWARIRTIILLGFIPIWPRIPAVWPLAFWFIGQFYVGNEQGIAWVAHVGGFVVGIVIGVLVRQDPGFRERLWVHRYRTTGDGAWDNRHGGTLTRF